MLTQVDKKSLFQDRYQALIMPVPVSGVFRHRALLKFQSLYPEHYTVYKQACERSQLLLGDVLQFTPQRDLAGMAVGGALSKPKYIVDMAVTEFAENSPHLEYIVSAFQSLNKVLFDWGRYQGVRRVAVLASDELLVPDGMDFDEDVLPLFEKYLQPVSNLNVMAYR
ncbi:hypothetical protein I6J32_09660 [Moraxella osloensis]|nr:hypothetical protein [Moraxella osloensis]QRO12869.1 hypothetical protein I6J32_09660 [Moraxella osloensis]